LKATNTDIPIGKYLIGRTSFFKDVNFSFFKVAETGPTITKPLAINHRSDQEHKSKLDNLIIFCRKLAQTSPVVCLIIRKKSLKQDMWSSVEHCQTIVS